MSVDEARPTVPISPAEPPRRKAARAVIARAAPVLRPWLVLFLVCAGFSLHAGFRHVFWTAGYLPNLLQQAATNIVLATGMTFVIMTGGIDLSVGSVLALSGVALGLTVRTGPPPFMAYLMALPAAAGAAWVAVRLAPPRARRPSAAVAGLCAFVAAGAAVRGLTAGGIQLEGAILAAFAVGGACGLINGAVSTFGRVPPFVATLGMLTAARGLTVYATDGNSISGLPPRLAGLGQGMPLVLAAFACVALGALLMTRTRWGRYVVAVGGNEEAARLSGVDVTGAKLAAYIFSGVAAALAAVLLTAKFGVADTGAGTNAELNAIAAVVIGGTSLSGGRGSVVGSLVGALTMAVLNAGLVLIQVRDTLQGVVIGAVIIGTVAIDQLRKAPGH